MAGIGIMDWGGGGLDWLEHLKGHLWDFLNRTDCIVWHVLLTAPNPVKHYNPQNTGSLSNLLMFHYMQTQSEVTQADCGERTTSEVKVSVILSTDNVMWLQEHFHA